MGSGARGAILCGLTDPGFALENRNSIKIQGVNVIQFSLTYKVCMTN